MILEENVRQAYLAAANGSVIDGNRFFNKFFVELLNDPWKITSRGQELLNACYDTDANAYSRIHKGAVYYYLGLAAFLFQDYHYNDVSHYYDVLNITTTFCGERVLQRVVWQDGVYDVNNRLHSCVADDN